MEEVPRGCSAGGLGASCPGGLGGSSAAGLGRPVSGAGGCSRLRVTRRDTFRQVDPVRVVVGSAVSGAVVGPGTAVSARTAVSAGAAEAGAADVGAVGVGAAEAGAAEAGAAGVGAADAPGGA
ncbi:hypothetical protein ACIRD3_36900 [Kitasatospora sp. NPDC093550]|uniref:hypothetical protein n=1 Tax=Kitasatospora sp. NPDC093550 TaxID=3364089 RepID=UPI0038086BB0